MTMQNQTVRIPRNQNMLPPVCAQRFFMENVVVHTQSTSTEYTCPMFCLKSLWAFH